MPKRLRKHSVRLYLLLLSAVLGAFGSLSAQQTNVESLVISAGDLLHVTIYREHDLEQHVRVNDAGFVSLALVGQVRVTGLPAAEAARQISKLYCEGGFLRQPQVSVLVEESTRQQVALLGEIAHPGVVPMTSPRSLLDVLSQAGGLTSVADRHVTVRRVDGTSQTVFLANAPDAAIKNADILVDPGDTILVPKAGIVYVLGDVARPGGFVMQDDAHLSLLQAISLASGTNKSADENGARLIRKTAAGGVNQSPLLLKNIERGKKADPQLQADDIVFVPFSVARNAVLGTTAILASAGSAAIYAFH